MAPRQDLASKLSRLREASGLSLRDLEEASGVARGTISRIESGEYQRPSPANLMKLSGALGVDTSELLTAAGYTASRAEALPNMRVYLRSKYGHLSADDRQRLVGLLDELESGRPRATKSTSTNPNCS